MGFLRRLFGRLLSTQRELPPQSDTVQKIAAGLESLPPRDAHLLAAFAYVLTRVALADRVVTEEEKGEMRRLAQEFGGLPPERAELVVKLATSHATEWGGTENYLVTRQFRELSTREERIGLIRCLFAVAAADREISEVENQQILQVASELGLMRDEVAAIRQAFRHHLSVLKDLPEPDGA